MVNPENVGSHGSAEYSNNDHALGENAVWMGLHLRGVLAGHAETRNDGHTQPSPHYQPLQNHYFMTTEHLRTTSSRENSPLRHGIAASGISCRLIVNYTDGNEMPGGQHDRLFSVPRHVPRYSATSQIVVEQKMPFSRVAFRIGSIERLRRTSLDRGSQPGWISYALEQTKINQKNHYNSPLLPHFHIAPVCRNVNFPAVWLLSRM
jgi:hypothetical protein